MKISREWLQTYFQAPLPAMEKLGEALTFHAFEIEGIEGDILDVKVTPNRGHDALSHRGIAKEISAILNIPLQGDPLKETPSLSPTSDAVSVIIEDIELCYRFTAGYIKGVKVGPSPDWLRQSLEAIGQRSINNVVDATNYVMFNIGQPVHAFDAGQLEEKDGKFAFEVRHAKVGEILLALDDKEYKLTESNLVVADKNSLVGQAGKAVGIAGVKGGKPAGITEATKDIIVECANFNGVSVRKTAKGLNLATDASQRFQQVISPELAAYGQRQTVDLILKIAGGELVGFADAYPKPAVPWQVAFTAAHTSKLLGIAVSTEEIQTTLTHLGFPFQCQDDILTVDVPFERLDLTIPEDLIEEVGRMIGYEKIPSKELPPFEKAVEPNENFAKAETIREHLRAKGYSEVFTSVFADKGEVAVLNKVDSVKPFLRSNLLDGLTEALKKNIQNKDLLGLKEVKIFEIGTVWKGGGEVIHVASIGEKEKAEEGTLADISAESIENLPISETERYQSFSRYPSITRDIALWVPADAQSEEVKNVIAKSAGSLMARIDQFDEFKKADKTSYAFRLVFQSSEKTLTDDEANGAMNSVYEAVKAKGWEVR
ncbi:MAG: phenylalanine--tRNA ligase subunit beta [Minisyncoccia bacterium]